MPDIMAGSMAGYETVGARKGLPLTDGPVTYQLVGEVTAHQGYDG